MSEEFKDSRDTTPNAGFLHSDANSEAHGHTFILFFEILTRFLARFLTRFLARFLTRFLPRVLTRFLARVLTINTVYSTTGTEKYSVQCYSDGKVYYTVLYLKKV